MSSSCGKRFFFLKKMVKSQLFDHVLLFSMIHILITY